MTGKKNSVDDKIKIIRTAATTALAGNLLLALLKITTGFLSGSKALVADGVDSSADVLISIIALIVVRIMAKPADLQHPWGHGRAETIATALLSFTLFFMGAQLLIGAGNDLLTQDLKEAPPFYAAVVALISIGGKILLAVSQYILGKRADSAMIKANAKNMTGDILISVSVLTGLVVTYLTGFVYADSIIALLIGVWIIKTAVGVFLEANMELMDGNSDTEPYRVIIEAVGAVEGASNPHRARIRRVAGFWDIDFDIHVDPDCTVYEAHNIASQVEFRIKQRLESVFDIMIHVEPHGDNAVEPYGLSEEELNEEMKAAD